MDVEQLTAEQLGSFQRAFAKPGAYIVIDGWSPRWAREDVTQAEALGLLTRKEDGDDQYTVIRFRPTDAFRSLLASRGRA